ncbi:Pre-mRNA-splicing factor [Drechslerella dactyloides]|uniref:Pre-mRNA-splicing factor n=1 Tax=Drechslerella dactyloides TaxID=74499 RepID=A0AAD6IWW7_DREDA|nr:Pre-mRNA-splicing factor [Drechslerella dactyloides]
MSLINASHDSLPYIDRPLTPTTTSRVNALIHAELDPAHSSTPHPSLPSLPPPAFSEFVGAELERIAQGRPFAGGVDPSRYESQAAPSAESSDEEWRRTLQQAYATSTHLANRVTNLTLLSSFGQNSWLIGNSQMEGVLGHLERELVALKEETEATNRERKRRQVAVQDEMERLERRWKDGVGKVLEIEVASEMVFRETLAMRRAGQS